MQKLEVHCAKQVSIKLSLNHCILAKGVVVELASLYVQSAWRSRGKRV